MLSREGVAQNLIALQKALGGGWQLRTGHEFVPEHTAAQMAERTNWGDILDADYPQGRDLGWPRPNPDREPAAIHSKVVGPAATTD